MLSRAAGTASRVVPECRIPDPIILTKQLVGPFLLTPTAASRGPIDRIRKRAVHRDSPSLIVISRSWRDQGRGQSVLRGLGSCLVCFLLEINSPFPPRTGSGADSGLNFLCALSQLMPTETVRRCWYSPCELISQLRLEQVSDISRGPNFRAGVDSRRI